MNIFSVFNEWVVIGLLLALLATVMIITGKHWRKKQSLRCRKATGVILALEKLSVPKEQQVDVKILVMVMPERSRNFVGELIETVLLTDLLQLKIGDKIPVEYSSKLKLALSRS